MNEKHLINAMLAMIVIWTVVWIALMKTMNPTDDFHTKEVWSYIYILGFIVMAIVFVVIDWAMHKYCPDKVIQHEPQQVLR